MKTKVIRNNKQANPQKLSSNENQKKKQLVSKIAQFFKNKFNKLFNDKGYNQETLICDLNLLISDNDLKTFNYDTAILRIEKSILEIVSKLESKAFKGVPDMNKISSLITKTEIKNEKEITQSKMSRQNQNKSMIHSKSTDQKTDNLLKKDRSLLLKDKAKDEWALIAKHNFEKFKEDEKEKKIKEEYSKKIQKEILENQMREKEILKLKHKEELEKFYSIQKENLKKIEQFEKDKQKEYLEKTKNQKKLQDLVIDQTQKQKQETKQKEKLEDQNLLKQIKNEMVKQEELQTKKKIDEREMYKKLIEDNEKKAIQKKLEKQNEKLENAKALEEYSKYIERQDEERKFNNQNRLQKMNIKYDNFSTNIKNKEALLNKYEENKFSQENAEIERRKKLDEEKFKDKIIMQKVEMKNALQLQIEEKKRLQQEKRNEEMKYMAVIKNNVDQFKNDITYSEKNKKEKSFNYKKQLDDQIKEKQNYKKAPMDEKERQLNRDLMNEINIK